MWRGARRLWLGAYNKSVSYSVTIGLRSLVPDFGDMAGLDPESQAVRWWESSSCEDRSQWIAAAMISHRRQFYLLSGQIVSTRVLMGHGEYLVQLGQDWHLTVTDAANGT